MFKSSGGGRMELRGKKVLVTGGARRIGAAISRALAAEGADVVVHCNRSLREAEALASALRDEFGVGVRVVR
ncbi:MAG: SDR family NAD(P)-dependent oxidoreductase, partial [Kiritimatiellae bacterium]|nr:SDR family NAD(P)-dependent oxidoreductase [Kiritimatiellia bacterium]